MLESPDAGHDLILVRGRGDVVGHVAGERPVSEIAIGTAVWAGMDIGCDNGGVVDLAYEKKAPYAFTGTIRDVVVDLNPAGVAKRPSGEEEKALHEHNQHVSVAAGVHG